MAPHVIATSVRIFVGHTRTDNLLRNVILLDGSVLRSVAGLAAVSGDTSLVLLRTSQPGQPVQLRRSGSVGFDEAYRYVGYEYSPGDVDFLPRPHWATGRIKLESFFTPNSFSAENTLPASSCGSPVFDRQGRLVGIINGVHDGRVEGVLSDEISRLLEKKE